MDSRSLSPSHQASMLVGQQDQVPDCRARSCWTGIAAHKLHEATGAKFQVFASTIRIGRVFFWPLQVEMLFC